ncbi:MAG TPA: hypothetical protein VH497_11230 [Vicinamibacterales bacterium]
MAAHEFVFALQLSDESHFDAMLAEVARALLAHVGYSAAATEELRATIRAALKSSAPAGQPRCDVSFRAQSGHLQITIAYAGGAEWRTSRPLP